MISTPRKPRPYDPRMRTSERARPYDPFSAKKRAPTTRAARPYDPLNRAPTTRQAAPLRPAKTGVNPLVDKEKTANRDFLIRGLSLRGVS
jgi:hypothetical protein